MHKVGFIGVGAMGKWMIKRLISNIEQLIIYDVEPDALKEFENENVIIADSLEMVAQNSEVIILMLPNSKIVSDVVLDEGGIINFLDQNTIIIDMSSSYALETEKMETLLNEKSIRLVDAPVSGGVPRARSGELTIMAGGNEDDYSEVLYLLQYLGKQITLIGSTGSGHALKAINNYVSAATMYATAEALMLAKKLGINPEIAIESINTSTGKSHSSEFKYPTYVIPEKFNSNFSLDLQLKDINMAKDMATEIHMPMLLGGSLIEIYEAAVSIGGEGQDHTEIIKFLEKICNEKLIEKNKFEEN